MIKVCTLFGKDKLTFIIRIIVTKIISFKQWRKDNVSVRFRFSQDKSGQHLLEAVNSHPWLKWKGKNSSISSKNILKKTLNCSNKSTTKYNNLKTILLSRLRHPNVHPLSPSFWKSSSLYWISWQMFHMWKHHAHR